MPTKGTKGVKHVLDMPMVYNPLTREVTGTARIIGDEGEEISIPLVIRGTP